MWPNHEPGWDCFQEGKTIQCMCCGTDSWHNACGRHARVCGVCDRAVCVGCEDMHRFRCRGQLEGEEDEDDEEDEEDEEGAG